MAYDYEHSFAVNIMMTASDAILSLCYISLLGTGATVPHRSANTCKAIADIAGKGPCSTTEHRPSAFAGERKVVWCGQQVGVVVVVAPAEKRHVYLQITSEIANIWFVSSISFSTKWP